MTSIRRLALRPLLVSSLAWVWLLMSPAYGLAQPLSFPLQLVVVDPVEDNTGGIDVTLMILRFDPITGAYELTLRASDAAPFVGNFRVNVNLYAVDLVSFFADTVNDYALSPSTTVLTLTGTSPNLRQWVAGTRVFTNSLYGTPNPPGSSLYRTAISTSSGFLTNEDYIAFADPNAPAIVTRVSDAVQPPAGLTAWSIFGNTVTLRWSTPPVGLSPTSHVVEGGLVAGQVLASFAVSAEYPIVTFTAPSGAFYVRMRSKSGADQSAPSNEIRIFVNTPAAPSAPVSLVAMTSGSSVALAWRNTFAGGTVQSLVLEAWQSGGTPVASLRLSPTDRFLATNVPSGPYQISLRAENASGESGRSNTVFVTVSEGCTGPPMVPANFLAYHVGSTVYVTWQPGEGGSAATAYLLNVSGPINMNVPTTLTTLSGTPGPGVYSLSVSATNMCGESQATRLQTLTVP
jgi:hypothetical protein